MRGAQVLGVATVDGRIVAVGQVLETDGNAQSGGLDLGGRDVLEARPKAPAGADPAS